MDQYVFDESGARRIVNAVRRVEGMPGGTGIGDAASVYSGTTIFLAQTTDLKVAPDNSSNWAVYSGTTFNSETKSSRTGLKGYVRKGIVYPNITYILVGINGKLEVINPTLQGIGKTNAAHSKGASGTINIYSGTLGSETATGSTLTAWNRFADVATTKWVRWAWNDDSKAFDLVSAEC